MAGLGYTAYRAFCPKGRLPPTGRVNPSVLKSQDKVVDAIDIEDINNKAVFCRCWRSKNVRIKDIKHVQLVLGMQMTIFNFHPGCFVIRYYKTKRLNYLNVLICRNKNQIS